MEIEQRNVKLIVGNNGSGFAQYKISLPNKWIHSLGLNKDNKDVVMSFDGEKIVIERVKAEE